MRIATGSNPILTVFVCDDSGNGIAGLDASTFPALSYAVSGNAAAVAFPTLNDLALITSNYNPGGIKERSGGYYRLDGPAAIATTDGATVTIIGEGSNKHVICPPLEVTTSPPTTSQIAAALFVDGSTNKLKVNADNTVDASGSGVAGGEVTGFTQDALDQLAGQSIAVVSPANIDVDNGTIEIVSGDDYLDSMNRSFTLTLTGSNLTDMSGASHAYLAFTTCKRIVHIFEVTIVSSNSTTIVLKVEFTSAQTSLLDIGPGSWMPEFTTAAGKNWSIPARDDNPFILTVKARPSE